MVLAAILRNYKCFKGINIIPFCKGELDCLSIIIGNNGVGKSAILEGLDTLFNEAPWIINKDNRGNKDEVSVGVVMLVEKSRVQGVLNAEENKLLESISDFFWTVEETNPTLRQYAKFFELRREVAEKRMEYCLFVAGREYDKKDILFLSFSGLLRSSLAVESEPVEGETDSKYSSIIEKVLSLYTYIYIPVENSISDFLKLQNQSLQSLMDSSVRDNIAKELTGKRIKRPVKKGKTRRLSVLEIINEFLEQYVNDVERDIQSVYEGYSYKPAPRQSSKLTANHVVDTIVSAFYSKRSFKKDDKEIQFLSSGEKRMVLIDIISAFVMKENASHELIIGIDEPENSLHVSKCYDQFKKIETIALDYNHQLFITTHWYGSLPCLSNGSLIHIDNHNQPSVYSIYNYYEERGGLPEDFYLKGFFDLSSSLLYAFRESSKHWLLVEGYEDKRYIEYHLNRPDVRIIPLGGCGNVRKLYEYMFIPCSSKEFKHFSKKMVCVIDTDSECPTLGVSSGDLKDVLKIRRLNAKDDGLVELVEINSVYRKETEVEDVLHPKQFYDSLQRAIDKVGDTDVKDAFSTFIFDDTAKTSRIKGDDSILKVNNLERNAKEDKLMILSFVDSHKDLIAEIYTETPYTGESLSWITSLNTLLQ